MQIHGVVVGFEADLSWTNFGDNTTYVFPGQSGLGTPPITFATSYQMDQFSTVRGRIGLPFDGLLIYGTGGLAFANVSMNTTITVGDLPMSALSGTQDKTKVGWTLGGGAEYAISDCVTVDVEQRIAGTITRAGVSYRF